jgi:hypothetical protein
VWKYASIDGRKTEPGVKSIFGSSGDTKQNIFSFWASPNHFPLALTQTFVPSLHEVFPPGPWTNLEDDPIFAE